MTDTPNRMPDANPDGTPDETSADATGTGNPLAALDEGIRAAIFNADGTISASTEAFADWFRGPQHVRDLADLDRQRMQALLANITDTVTLVDADGTVLYSTGFHSDVLGFPEDSWRGRSIIELADPADLDDLLLLRQRVLDAPGVEVRSEVRVANAEGVFQQVELSAVNLLDDPNVRGIVVTTRNVTGRKSIERELAQRRDAAIEEARLRDEFVARVSHELRNQVHALHGLTELLSHADVPASARHLAVSAQRQAEQFEFLVNDLLEYSRMAAADQDVVDRPCIVRQVVADAESVGRQLARPNVTVTSRVDAAVPDLVGLDESRLRQVLMNLLSNAAKFTHDGSIGIDVTVTGTASLAFEVSDTGIGIAADDVARAFQPFEHVGDDSSDHGAGLGLSITERAVQLLGGSISLESELGRGSRFCVTVPFRSAPTERSYADDNDDLRASVHVLVVEDNEVNQLLVAEQLRRLGARATVAGSGQEALDLLDGGELPDCVLMDWQLPGIDGLETTRRIRAKARTAELAVIGMTASALPADRHACLDAGMNDLLVKPVGLRDLAGALNEWAPAGGPSPDDSTDVAALDALAEDLGSFTPVRSIVTTYLVELDRRCEAIVDGVATGDAELVRGTAHTLRSTSRTLGARRIDELSTEFETGEFPPAPGRLDEFKRVVDETRTALTGWLEAHSEPA